MQPLGCSIEPSTLTRGTERFPHREHTHSRVGLCHRGSYYSEYSYSNTRSLGVGFRLAIAILPRGRNLHEVKTPSRCYLLLSSSRSSYVRVDPRCPLAMYKCNVITGLTKRVTLSPSHAPSYCTSSSSSWFY